MMPAARRSWIAVLVVLSTVPFHAQDGAQPWQLGLSVASIVVTVVIATVAVAGLMWKMFRDSSADFHRTVDASRAESRREHDQLHHYVREPFAAHDERFGAIDRRFDEIDERDRKRAAALVQGLF